MTNKEFIDWVAETKISEKCWICDEIQLYNNNRLTFYKGGVNGTFISIYTSDPKGDCKLLISVGTYENAIPHIGEALFKITKTKTFEKFKTATEFLHNSNDDLDVLYTSMMENQ